MDNLIKELDLQAQKHISGGFWDWVVGTFLGGMLYDLTFHTGETIESFNAGRDAANAMSVSYTHLTLPTNSRV